jgi:hypothetical protein
MEGLPEDELIKSPLITQHAEAKVGTKLDLACGTQPRTGYIGVDALPLDELVSKTERFEGTAPAGYKDYIQADLFEFPWPFEDESIAATYSAHFVEHIPHQIPGTDWKVDGWWHWFSELYRVMEDGGICEFIHPFSRSDRAFWDPTHTRFIHYQTWFYLSREHRLKLGVNHYAPEINFDVLEIQTIHEPTFLEGRSADVIEFARQFYFNPTDDLFVVLQVNK